MQSRLLGFGLAVMLGLAQSAFAHGGEHHGKPVMGYVTSTEKDSFTIKGDKGETKVSVSSETEYTTGNGSEKTDMRPRKGDHVMVYGTTLENGQVVAAEVMVHREGAKSDMDGGHDMDQRGHMNQINDEHAGHHM